jgi:hypothetical protein
MGITWLERLQALSARPNSSHSATDSQSICPSCRLTSPLPPFHQMALDLIAVILALECPLWQEVCLVSSVFVPLKYRFKYVHLYRTRRDKQATRNVRTPNVKRLYSAYTAYNCSLVTETVVRWTDAKFQHRMQGP